MHPVQQTFAIGWFPSEDWAAALQRWPELGEDLPEDHAGYRAGIETRMRTISDRARGARLLLVPVTVQDILEQADTEGVDPDDADVRGRAASRRAQEGAGRQWPPARNDLCWCTSEVKYKYCCGATVAPSAEPA